LPSIFQRSKAHQYQDKKPGSIAGMLRVDSMRLRLMLFIAMSAIFFLLLKVTERKIPHGLMPDSTEDTSQVSVPSRSAPAPHVPSPPLKGAPAPNPSNHSK
jgi:hypothetical protein